MKFAHKPMDETERRAILVATEKRALTLFDRIEAERLIAPGRTEREVDASIHELAQREFGVEKHWHRRIVRTGPNTLATSADNPPVRMIEPDDTVYVDLGPVFEDWEADIGRTYALGNDPEKKRLVADLPRVFDKVQKHFHASPEITGAELYAFACAAAEEAGWIFGGQIAGHIISEFPHAHIPGDRNLNRITPLNSAPLRNLDGHGRPRHWILEIHLVDHARTFGGFYERLI